MEKDETILEFLKNNKELIDSNLWSIVDFWDADKCAIGLIKNDKLAYISTYHYTDNYPVKYDCQLELGSHVDVYKAIKTIYAATEKDLIHEMKLFLK